MFNMSFATLVRFLSNFPVCLVLGTAILVISLAGFHNRGYVFRLFLHPVSIIRDRQYYRLFTSDLVHHNLFHLILNEAMLFTYGGNLETHLNRKLSFGSIRFSAIYIFSCLFASVFATIRNRRDFGYSSAGASGSIMGCLFGFTILQPGMVAFALPVVGNVTNLYFSLIVIIGVVVYRQRRNNELLNHDLHFFGALGGLVGTLIFCPGIIKWPG